MRREIEATVHAAADAAPAGVGETTAMRELYQVTDAYVEKLSACEK